MAYFKTKIDDLDKDKNKTVFADLSKLSNKVDMIWYDIVYIVNLITVYDKSALKVNAIDTKKTSTSRLVTKTVWFRKARSWEENWRFWLKGWSKKNCLQLKKYRDLKQDT